MSDTILHVSQVVGDTERQAVAALRGYAYQIYASVLAWLSLSSDEDLVLEVAEDYARVSQQAVNAVQVKDTAGSGSITLRTASVAEAIDGYVYLAEKNPARRVTVRFLTTSDVGLERARDDRPCGERGLNYWRRAASHADVSPLREILLRLQIEPRTRAFIEARSDDALRTELLQRIHWECGAPPVGAIREQVVATILAVTEREGVRLNVSEARQAAGSLVEHAFATIVTSTERRLTHLQLRDLLERAGNVSIARRDLEALLRGSAGSFLAANEAPRPIDDVEIPTSIAERHDLIESVVERLRTRGIAFICGATGMGKTMLARLVARRLGTGWCIADFGGLDAAQTADRLKRLLGEVAVSSCAGLVLDDLNQAESPLVVPSLTRLRAALTRRDVLCIASSYCEPSSRLRTELDVDAGAVVQASALTAREVSALVDQAGGQSAEWTDELVLTTRGHPQLVHATISHLKSMDWPRAQLDRLRAFDTGGLDIAEQKTAARRRLVEAAPEPARILLYRVSLLMGSFRRQIALVVAQTPPAIPSASDHLDSLTGPWIDSVAGGRLRISPLLSDAGQAALTKAEQTAVHATAAEALTAGPSLEVEDAANGLAHALLARVEEPLLRLSVAIISAEPDGREQLASWLTLLVVQPTEKPIFPENPAVSRQLRLAQLLLALASQTAFLPIWTALRREIQAVPDDHQRERFEAAVLVKVLLSPRAVQLPDWIFLLARLDELFSKHSDLAPSKAVYDAVGDHLAFFLVNLAMGIGTVRGLAAMFDQIRRLDPKRRARILTALRTREDDLVHLINHPWIAEHDDNKGMPALAQAAAYRQMASLAAKWGARRLAIFCHIARTTLLDEYVDDQKLALAGLDEAEAEHGADPAITRARAKIAFHRRQHGDALKLLRSLEPDTDGFDVVERAFIYREAAISAAETGDHPDSLASFRKALAAAQSVRSETFRTTAIGLEADVAVAQFRCGDRVGAITGLWAALDAAEQADPHTSLKATYLHKILGHACLWASGSITREDFEGIGMPTIAPPGMCSNPSPSEGIRDLPRASIKGSRYLLVIADITMGGSLGLDEALDRILGGQYITALEVQRRLARLERAMAALDIGQLGARLAEAFDAMWQGLQRMNAGDDAAGLPLLEGPFPQPPVHERSGDTCQRFVDDAFFALYILGDLGQPRLTPSYFEPVTEDLARRGYATPAFTDPASEARQRSFWNTWRDYRAGPVLAETLFVTGLRMLEWAKPSLFARRLLLGPLGRWAQRDWSVVASEQAFRLRTPAVAVPALQAALDAPGPDEHKLATILRAAVPAFNVNLPPSAYELLDVPALPDRRWGASAGDSGPV